MFTDHPGPGINFGSHSFAWGSGIAIGRSTHASDNSIAIGEGSVSEEGQIIIGKVNFLEFVEKMEHYVIEKDKQIEKLENLINEILYSPGKGLKCKEAEERFYSNALKNDSMK